MSRLSEDLVNLAGEFDDEKDLKKRAKIGAKIIGEVLGGASLIVGVVVLLTNGLPMIGIPVTAYMVKTAVVKVAKVYSDWNEDQRKCVRAVFALLRRFVAF